MKPIPLLGPLAPLGWQTPLRLERRELRRRLRLLAASHRLEQKAKELAQPRQASIPKLLGVIVQ